MNGTEFRADNLDTVGRLAFELRRSGADRVIVTASPRGFLLKVQWRNVEDAEPVLGEAAGQPG